MCVEPDAEDLNGVLVTLSDEYESKTTTKDVLNHLSEAEMLALRELSSSTLFQVINEMAQGSTLTSALQKVAPVTLDRVQLVLQNQYSDNVPERGVGDLELDSTISEFICEHALNDEGLQRMARVTPLRLSYEERAFLRLLEATLDVSEYTDKVDILGHRYTAAKRISNEIKHICAVLSGLVLAYQYEAGQILLRERDFKSNEAFFRTIFEIGRRYKILNPERMRGTYGKLIYFLMDTCSPNISEHMQLDLIAPIQTVWTLLNKRKNGFQLLKDPLISVATAEINATGKSASQIQLEIKRKESAVKKLVRTYGVGHQQSPGLLSRFRESLFRGHENPERSDPCTTMSSEKELTYDEVELVLYSLGDHNTFLRFNREPCDKMISYLKQYFHPHKCDPEYSLSISCGSAGARLSHSHERQYHYVLQSLTLWREVLHDMLGLWCLAEKDLLSPKNSYVLRDTGQGLQRIQDAPHVYRSMYTILSRVQQHLGEWCGSSVIHLGDSNVPNALMFIDKYIQVPRILGPVTLCLDKIPELYCSSPAMKQHIDTSFGGCDALIKTILVDFFRHAFDGSGADNFYDAGSCIDGRLTSAWNWCSRIEKKNYFFVFLLTGFTGFDGRF